MGSERERERERERDMMMMMMMMMILKREVVAVAIMSSVSREPGRLIRLFGASSHFYKKVRRSAHMFVSLYNLSVSLLENEDWSKEMIAVIVIIC